MNVEIINKLDEITSIIDNDIENQELISLKKEIESNNDLISKIKKIKGIEKYNEEYLKLKKEILENETYSRYQHLENDLYIIAKEISSKLKKLEEKGGCKWK